MKQIRYPKKTKSKKKRKGKILNYLVNLNNSDTSSKEKNEDKNNNNTKLYPKEYINELTNEDLINLKLDDKTKSCQSKDNLKEKNKYNNRKEKKIKHYQIA